MENIKGSAGHSKNYDDLLKTTLIFIDALKLILKEGQGIVVSKPKKFNGSDDFSKAIVYKFENELNVYKCDEDLADGTVVEIDYSSKNI